MAEQAAGRDASSPTYAYGDDADPAAAQAARDPGSAAGNAAAADHDAPAPGASAPADGPDSGAAPRGADSGATDRAPADVGAAGAEDRTPSVLTNGTLGRADAAASGTPSGQVGGTGPAPEPSSASSGPISQPIPVVPASLRPEPEQRPAAAQADPPAPAGGATEAAPAEAGTETADTGREEAAAAAAAPAAAGAAAAEADARDRLGRPGRPVLAFAAIAGVVLMATPFAVNETSQRLVATSIDPVDQEGLLGYMVRPDGDASGSAMTATEERPPSGSSAAGPTGVDSEPAPDTGYVPEVQPQEQPQQGAAGEQEDPGSGDSAGSGSGSDGSSSAGSGDPGDTPGSEGSGSPGSSGSSGDDWFSGWGLFGSDDEEEEEEEEGSSASGNGRGGDESDSTSNSSSNSSSDSDSAEDEDAEADGESGGLSDRNTDGAVPLAGSGGSGNDRDEDDDSSAEKGDEPAAQDADGASDAPAAPMAPGPMVSSDIPEGLEDRLPQQPAEEQRPQEPAEEQRPQEERPQEPAEEQRPQEERPQEPAEEQQPQREEPQEPQHEAVRDEEPPQEEPPAEQPPAEQPPPPPAPEPRYEAVAGVGCAPDERIAYGTSGEFWEGDGTDSWAFGFDGGYTEQNCDGRWHAIPVSGDPAAPSEPYSFWTFNIGFTGANCDIYVHIPEAESPRWVGGVPAYYQVHPSADPATSEPFGSFRVNQVEDKGSWVHVGQYSPPGDTLSVKLNNRGADQVDGQDTNAHVVASAVRTSCT
ncbi:hypothetical protein ACFOVU_25535 [Nocardiopsis sediminis]|uniref:Translation initiation factor IF-2 n=1 Tax=Nocardiopsis sediminis TaxID=1778267 RepID=A0ABV8FW38_9ACTN